MRLAALGLILSGCCNKNSLNDKILRGSRDSVWRAGTTFLVNKAGMRGGAAAADNSGGGGDLERERALFLLSYD